LHDRCQIVKIIMPFGVFRRGNTFYRRIALYSTDYQIADILINFKFQTVNMKSSIGIFWVLFMALSACGSQDSVRLPGGTSPMEKAGVAASSPNVPIQESVVSASSNSQLNPEHGKPGHRCEIAVGAPLNSESQPIVSAPVVATPTSSINSSSAANIPLNLKGLTSLGSASGALNPEHGKPGHRCELAVGAPLNGSAAQPQASVTPTSIPVNQPNIQAPITIPANTGTGGRTSATGLNPEHGKPGHRCDIAVGAPLNSKPITTSSPSKVTSTSVVAPVKSGMNPQHGQTGHRCDIAVGAPLNSKPTTTTVEKPVASTPATDISGN
jgi:hypothetical protein